MPIAFYLVQSFAEELKVGRVLQKKIEGKFYCDEDGDTYTVLCGISCYASSARFPLCVRLVDSLVATYARIYKQETIYTKKICL